MPAGTCGPHTIRDGDSFFALSVQRGFSVDDMIAVNPGVVPENLQIGQRVNLPCTGAVNGTISEPQPQPDATGKIATLKRDVTIMPKCARAHALSVCRPS